MTKQEATSIVNRSFRAINYSYPSDIQDKKGWLGAFREKLLPYLDSYEECFVLSLPTDGSYYKDHDNFGLFEELDEKW